MSLQSQTKEEKTMNEQEVLERIKNMSMEEFKNNLDSIGYGDNRTWSLVINNRWYDCPSSITGCAEDDDYDECHYGSCENCWVNFYCKLPNNKTEILKQILDKLNDIETIINRIKKEAGDE